MRNLFFAIFAACFATSVLASEFQRSSPRATEQSLGRATPVQSGRGQQEAEQQQRITQSQLINRRAVNNEATSADLQSGGLNRRITTAAPASGGIGLLGNRAAVVNSVHTGPVRGAAASPANVRVVNNQADNALRGRAAATPTANNRAAPAAMNNRGPAAMTARSATANTARSARATVQAPGRLQARSAVAPNVARNTALFTNTAAMGTEFNQCREVYFTCMDQFCGLMNDVYRRCICSERFRGFRDREEAFSAARSLILQFNDQNLNVVDLSADEVDAMFRATEGELAMRVDASEGAQMLQRINDLIAGRVTPAPAPRSNNRPVMTDRDLQGLIGGFSADFTAGGGSIWDSGGGGSIWDTQQQPQTSLIDLEGRELYDTVSQQCMEAAAACHGNQAITNMARSAYTVLIAQDCNMYERNLDVQRAALEATVREANRMLMDARLDNFRANNSANFNECLDRVTAAMREPLACGPNWERCLDFTGQFVNPTTGEPILTPIFFQLRDQIDLFDHNSPNTRRFLAGLDERRRFAQAALGTCQVIADDVWNQFSRHMALIEIGQAQGRLIEQVEGSCIQTVSECYDTQLGAMRDFSTVQGDDEASRRVQSTTGALAHRTAAALCQDRVMACAALFNRNQDTACIVQNGRITNADACGMAALLRFINTVDDTRVTMACRSELERYVQELCTPTRPSTMPATGWPFHQRFPYGCRTMPFRGANSFYSRLMERAAIVCINPETRALDETGARAIQDIANNVQREMTEVLTAACQYAAPGGQAFFVADRTPRPGTQTGSVPVTVWPQYISLLHSSTGVASAFSEAAGQAFAATISTAFTVNVGEAARDAVGGVQTLVGRAAPMTAQPRDQDGRPVEGLVSSENMQVQSWGMCEVIPAALLCEVMNALVNEGDENIANFNRDTAQCLLSPNYPQILCERFLGSGELGGPGAAIWNTTTNTCEFNGF